MIESRLQIINKLGLHARAAAKFVSTASGFDCDVRVGRNGQMVDGKSIMAVMMLAANKGTELEIRLEGEEEEAALEAIQKLVGDRFGEGE